MVEIGKTFLSIAFRGDPGVQRDQRQPFGRELEIVGDARLAQQGESDRTERGCKVDRIIAGAGRGTVDPSRVIEASHLLGFHGGLEQDIHRSAFRLGDQVIQPVIGASHAVIAVHQAVGAAVTFGGTQQDLDCAAAVLLFAGHLPGKSQLHQRIQPEFAVVKFGERLDLVAFAQRIGRDPVQRGVDLRTFQPRIALLEHALPESLVRFLAQTFADRGQFGRREKQTRAGQFRLRDQRGKTFDRSPAGAALIGQFRVGERLAVDGPHLRPAGQLFRYPAREKILVRGRHGNIMVFSSFEVEDPDVGISGTHGGIGDLFPGRRPGRMSAPDRGLKMFFQSGTVGLHAHDRISAGFELS